MSTITNPPGLSQLAYRVRTYATSFAEMQQNLGAFVIPGSSPPLRPLAALTTRALDDPTIALLDAWAIVVDVLAFYQERIANEGYLRTATELMSLIELAGALGYELNPGVAASAALAFVVQSAPGVPAQASVPVGTQVQSVPGQNQLPQVFETTQAITATVAWNSLAPILTQPQRLEATSSPPSGGTGATITLVLTGFGYNLPPGALLWVPCQHDAVYVTQATSNPVGGTTQVQVAGNVPLAPSPSLPTLTAQVMPSLVAQLMQQGPTTSNVTTWILGYSWPAALLDAFLGRVGWDPNAVGSVVAGLQAAPPSLQVVRAFQQQVGFWGRAVAGATTTTVQQNGGGSTTYTTTPGTILTPAPGPYVWQPGAGASSGTVLLERTVPGIGVNSFVVLVDTAATTTLRPTSYQVTNVALENVTINGTNSQVTQLVLQGDASQQFPTASTIAYVQSQDLPLAPTVPLSDQVVAGGIVQLDGMAIGLEPGQLVALTGERDDGTGATQTEVMTLSAVTHAGGYTTLTFQGNLQNGYFASTVTLSANVAPATQGQTTANAVLGSGDGSQQNQTFTLSKPSLTYVEPLSQDGGTPPIPPGGGTAVSTLAVSVNGVPWQEVPTLYGQPAQSRVYMTRIDDQASTSVIFGDGQQGARVPTGTENVTATYRTGLGPAGNVAAGALMLLFNPPLGVRTVSNPLAAAGGVAPEALEDARVAAPRAVRALGRVVTLSDYEDFAADYAGVGKAQATALERDGDPFVEVTVAAPGGSAPDTVGLSNAIAAVVDPAQLQLFQVDPCRPAYFAVTAWLTFAAGAGTAAVTAAAQAALQSAFGFAARGFGQSVRAVEVIVALQGVPGVLGVQLLAFYRLDTGPGPTPMPVLTAAPASVALGAELLLISPDPSDVTLTSPPT